MHVIYKIGSKYWDTELGKWVTDLDQVKEVIALTNDGKPADEEFLLKTLKLYKFPLGELAPNEAESLEERIKALEEELAAMKSQLATFQSSSGTTGGLNYGI